MHVNPKQDSASNGTRCFNTTEKRYRKFVLSGFQIPVGAANNQTLIRDFYNLGTSARSS
jgi:hypothetical protein